MSFTDNLQYLRKKQNLTQEQFAEQLEVSRQAVSKWESGQSYPELEKLLQICELFGCSMDTLLKGDVTEAEKEDLAGYDLHMNHFSIMTAFAVSLIIFSVVPAASLEGILNEAFTSIIMFILIGIGVYILIISNVNHRYYLKRYPSVADFYTGEQRDDFHRKYAIAMASGVSLLLFALCLNVVLEYMQFPYFDEAGGAVFLICTSLAVGIFIYFGLQKDKYNIEKYNQANLSQDTEKGRLAGKLCGAVMLLATALFLFLGLAFGMFRYAAVIFPIAGIFCAIICLFLGDKR